MKRKSEGSALIYVIIIFSVISMLAVTFSSMISANYISRMSESKRVENLYASESGLDISYNIISKTIDAANRKGYEDVGVLKEEVKLLNEKLGEGQRGDNTPYIIYKDIRDEDQKVLFGLYRDIDYWKYYNENLKNGGKPLGQDKIDLEIKRDEEDIEKLLNIVFRKSFKTYINENLENYIVNGTYVDVIEDEDGDIQFLDTDKVNYDGAIISVGEKSSEIDNLEDLNEGAEEDKTTIKWAQEGEKNLLSRSSLNIEDGYEDGIISYYEDKSILNNDKFEYVDFERSSIKVKSKFLTREGKGNTIKVGENTRVIEAESIITVPNYDQVAFKNSIVSPDDVRDIPGLTVGNNMDLENSGQVSVTGDIFVQGEEAKVDKNNRTYEKYSGGIRINNNNSINSKVIFNDNVFTRETFNIKNNVDVVINGDLYAKNIYAGDKNKQAKKSSLEITNKNAGDKESKVVLDNDLTVKAFDTKIKISNFYGINDKTIKDEDKPRRSSSIIINDYKAESGSRSSVNIANEAYIAGVAHINTEDGYQTGESVAVKGNYDAYSVPISPNDKLGYHKPLQLVDDKDINQKANHFKKYWDGKPVDFGGVTFENIKKVHSIGAIPTEDGVVEPNYFTEGLDAVLGGFRKEYAKNIYLINKDGENSDKDLKDLYDGKKEAEKVSDLLNRLSKNHNLKNRVNDGSKFTMFCSQADKTIVIKGKNNSGNKYNNSIEIDASDNKNLKSVLVTKGDIIFDGDVNFRGNIICEGDFKLVGKRGSKSNIYYDKKITKEIQCSNSGLFEEVFGTGFGGEELINSDDQKIKTNSSNFLKTKLWKIIK